MYCPGDNLVYLDFDSLAQFQQGDLHNANKHDVALELQAAFLAGVWAADADRRNQFDNRVEISEAINVAEAVGDDRIQQQKQGRVDNESWTHGSSKEHQQWIQRGFETGSSNRCRPGRVVSIGWLATDCAIDALGRAASKAAMPHVRRGDRHDPEAE